MHPKMQIDWQNSVCIILNSLLYCRTFDNYSIFFRRLILFFNFSHKGWWNLSLVMRKPVLCHMRTTNVQINLRIRLCCSLPACTCLIWNFKTRASFCCWAGWFVSNLPKDRFSHDMAHFITMLFLIWTFIWPIKIISPNLCRANPIGGTKAEELRGKEATWPSAISMRLSRMAFSHVVRVKSNLQGYKAVLLTTDSHHFHRPRTNQGCKKSPLLGLVQWKYSSTPQLDRELPT